MQGLTQESWFTQLHKEQQEHVALSLELYQRELDLKTKLVDYSFLVFPIAKAYEGFLKSYFYSLGLIDKQTYEGTRFRIGRALNPDISNSHKDEHWVYDDVTQICGEALAKQLWQAWLECRNRVFHYYPKKATSIDIYKAQQHIIQLIEAIKAAVECKIDDEARSDPKKWEN